MPTSVALDFLGVLPHIIQVFAPGRHSIDFVEVRHGALWLASLRRGAFVAVLPVLDLVNIGVDAHLRVVLLLPARAARQQLGEARQAIRSLHHLSSDILFLEMGTLFAAEHTISAAVQDHR